MTGALDDLMYGKQALDIGKFREIEHELFMSQVKDVSAGSLDEMSGEIGDLQHLATDERSVTRMVMSAIDIFDDYGIHAHWAGFDASGRPMIWLDIDTGVVNLTNVNFNGTVLGDALVTLNQLGYVVYQTATVGSETRVLRIGLYDNGSYPEARLEYYEPSSGGAVEIPNGDFATNDMTDWTAVVGDWDASAGYGTSTAYYYNPKVESARFALTAGTMYEFGARTFGRAAVSLLTLPTSVEIEIKIDVKFYSAGGTLLSTQTMTTRSKTATVTTGSSGPVATLEWLEEHKILTAPASTTQGEIVAYINRVSINTSPPYAGGSERTISIDDFTCQAVSAQSLLRFADNGLYYTPPGGSEVNLLPTSPTPQVTVVLTDVKSNGTHGGASVAGIQTRTLNTISASESGYCSLSSNRFTLVAGTWVIEAIAPAFLIGNHKVFIYNVTSGAYHPGMSANANSSYGLPTTSTAINVYTLTASTMFEIKHYTQIARATNNALGWAASSGYNEVYTTVVCRKIK